MVVVSKASYICMYYTISLLAILEKSMELSKKYPYIYSLNIAILLKGCK